MYALGFETEAHAEGLVRFRQRLEYRAPGTRGYLVELDFGLGFVHEDEFFEALEAGGVDRVAAQTEIAARSGV